MKAIFKRWRITTSAGSIEIWACGPRSARVKARKFANINRLPRGTKVVLAEKREKKI
jgi:hypothetical protein